MSTEDRTPIAEKGTLTALREDSGTIWDIKSMFILGVLLLFLGATLAIFSWPDTTYSAFTDSYTEHGSVAGFYCGVAVAGFGQIFLTIGIIASGVRIGMDTPSRVDTPTP